MSPEERKATVERAIRRLDGTKSKTIDTHEVPIWNCTVEDARTALRFIEAHGGHRRSLREFLQ